MTTDAPIAGPENEADILCPLCEYNLRGLSEPRCPECGHRSTWEELRNRPPLHRFLFEHHPESNVWSFLWTLFGSLRPMKFWRSVKPAMPLRTGRLIAFALVCAFFGLIGSSFGVFGTIAQMAQRNAMQRQQWASAYAIPGNASSALSKARVAAGNNYINQRYGSIQAYQTQVFPPITSSQFWVNAWNSQILSPRGQTTTVRAASVVLFWIPLTIASLLIFRASMRQAKIRNGHVLRCVLYTTAPICLYGVYLMVATFILSFFTWTSMGYTMFGYVDATYLACAAFVLFLGIRLSFAYRLYLRFPHAIATVIASQIIVALAMLQIDMMILQR